mmetsp:Transcript_15532/g.38477  ORF Transcript_15532/g.38477 Transcript_15532/m.38477 type:complete len:225 (-) Transcript_15532:383-1057(-)
MLLPVLVPDFHQRSLVHRNLLLLLATLQQQVFVNCAHPFCQRYEAILLLLAALGLLAVRVENDLELLDAAEPQWRLQTQRRLVAAWQRQRLEALAGVLVREEAGVRARAEEDNLVPDKAEHSLQQQEPRPHLRRRPRARRGGEILHPRIHRTATFIVIELGGAFQGPGHLVRGWARGGIFLRREQCPLPTLDIAQPRKLVAHFARPTRRDVCTIVVARKAKRVE